VIAWSGVSIVVLAALVAGFLFMRSRVVSVEGSVDALTKRRQEHDTRLLRLEDLGLERDKLQSREGVVKSLRDSRSVCHLLAELAKRASDMVWLELVTVSEPGGGDVSVASADSAVAGRAPRQVRVTGFSAGNAELARFMSSLQRSAYVHDPVLTISKRERLLDREATRFEVRFDF